MTSLDVGLQTLRSAAYRVNLAWDRLGKTVKRFMPTGLYARALLIIIAPMVVLQSVVAFVFMERHWNSVTQKLSSAVVSDIAALIDVYRGYPQDGAACRRSGGSRRSGSGWWSISCPRAKCRRPGRSRFSRCSTRRCRWSCESSSVRSGSTRSANRRWLKSASSSTTR